MTSNHSLRRTSAALLVSGLLAAVAGCSRGPQTAAELFDRMPRRYSGQLRVQGETGTRTLGVELLDLKVRDEYHLEFNRIAYEVDGGNEGRQRGEAPVRGTVSAPGGEVRIEDTGGVGGGDALKAGSFEGKVSADLEKADAKWKTGFDQAVGFHGEAGR